MSLADRIPRDEALRHPSRAAMLAVVRDHPNVTLAEVARLSGVNKSVARHHLRVPERTQWIRARRVLGKPCFVAARFEDGVRAFPEATSRSAISRVDPLVAHILDATPRVPVRMNPFLVAIAEATGYSRVGAWKGVRRGAAHRLLVLTRSSNRLWVSRADPTHA